ncbi:STM3941 family protein [Oricola sp.]|uniref:STM3941 family protein n=1 Tax=Oricola sp. TaxID=1979950 RepID=UPI003BA8687B
MLAALLVLSMDRIAPDIRRPVSIRRSLSKSIALIAAHFAVVALGVCMVRDGVIGSSYGESTVYAGWAIIVLSGVRSVQLLGRLFFVHPTYVVLSPTGFTDKRCFRGEIPWSAIDRMSVWTFRLTSSIHLRLHADHAADFNPTWSSRFTRWIKRRDIIVFSSDLDVSFSELLEVMRSFFEDYQPSALDEH